MPRPRRYVMSAMLALLTLTTFPSSAEATGDGLWAGACLMTMTVSFSSSVGVAPTAATVGASASGSCAVNTSLGSGSLAGGGAMPLLGLQSCAGGLVSGATTFAVDVPDVGAHSVGFQMVYAGGTASVVIYSIPRLVGHGEFVRDPASLAACATGQRISSMVFTGVLAFEDPDVPQPE